MVQELIEAVLLHLYASPKMPFRFRQTNQSPSERSVSSEHQQDHPITPKDRKHYCVQVRVILGDREGDQPPLSHAWGGSLAWQEDWITETVVLSPGEAIPFLSGCSRIRGFPTVGQEMQSLA